MNIKHNNIEAPFQLYRTWISKLDFSNNCLEYHMDADGEREIDVSYKVIKSEKSKDDNWVAHLMLQVEIRTKTSDGLFRLLLQLNGLFFGISDQIEFDTFNEMLRLNGCSSLYSIARAQINSITSQAFSGGNVLIPLVNFIQFRKAEDKDDNK